MLLLVTKKSVEKALGQALDPETGLSMLDMGMIRGVTVKAGAVKLKLKPTSPFCPMVSYLVQEIKNKVSAVKGVKSVDVEVVFH